MSEWARCKAAEGEDDGSVLPYVTDLHKARNEVDACRKRFLKGFAYRKNNPKHLIFLIPPKANLGEYRLTIKTFYSGTTRILKKPRTLELSLTIDHKL